MKAAANAVIKDGQLRHAILSKPCRSPVLFNYLPSRIPHC